MNWIEHLKTFRHKTTIQIRFKDIDKQGHVNNAVHLTYFETARSDYFKKILRQKNNWAETGIILASTTIDYKRPILLEDDLFCYTKISHLGSKSFVIEHILTVQLNQKEEIAAVGKSTMVCFNYETNNTIAVPIPWIESVKEYELTL